MAALTSCLNIWQQGIPRRLRTAMERRCSHGALLRGCQCDQGSAGERRGASFVGRRFRAGGASFHGHWQLCQFLVEQSADVIRQDPETGESALHNALCSEHQLGRNRVLRVLLANAPILIARPKRAWRPGGFMRDVRTKCETPLHRAAAFGDQEAIQLLLEAGATIDAKDMNGGSPLTWASWHLRPYSILRILCYGTFRVREGRAGMGGVSTGRTSPITVDLLNSVVNAIEDKRLR